MPLGSSLPASLLAPLWWQGTQAEETCSFLRWGGIPCVKGHGGENFRARVSSFLDSCPLNRWCYLTISSSPAPFSFCPQSFPTSGSFPMSQFFPSGGQSIGASASVLPMNIQGWFPLRLTCLISLITGLIITANLRNSHQGSCGVTVDIDHLGCGWSGDLGLRGTKTRLTVTWDSRPPRPLAQPQMISKD